MAKNRQVSTHFWTDSIIRTLDTSARYLFLYLITNAHTNIIHVYELPLDVMQFETSLEPDILDNAIEALTDKKRLLYLDNYVILLNAVKNQNKSPKIEQAVEREKEELPIKIQDLLKKIDKS